MERISDYDYNLPADLIAQTPLPERSDSRLLHLDRRTGDVAHRQFRDAVQLLREGDLLVMNETRVSAIRLFGRKETGGAIEALLLREVSPRVFDALLSSSRKPKWGSFIEFEGGLRGRVDYDPLSNDEPRWQITFEPAPDFTERLDAAGHAPLPPYIHTPLADRERYQTVYSRAVGSVAAPTAGLHFTAAILDELVRRGVRLAKVTLHVGTDTFRPVKVDDPARHEMTGEACEVPDETAEQVSEARGRIIAVGTTTIRTLESLASGPRRVRAGRMLTRLYIRPGFEFRIVDGMFTNFHMPRTTMMMMISAFAGREAVMRAYASAVENRYRFLSFGDSMIIL